MLPVNDKYILNRAIQDSYGQVLNEWKDLNLLPSKELMLSCVNTLSTAFIVENYELTIEDKENIVKELLMDVTTLDSLEAVYEFKSSLEELNIFLPFPERKKLNASEMLTAFRNGEIFLPHKDYSWETIRELYTLDDNIFNTDDIDSNVFKSMNHLFKILGGNSLIDFGNIPGEKGLLQNCSNFLWGLSGDVNDLRILKSNDAFLSKFLEMDCLPDCGISHSFINVISNKSEAKAVLKSLYAAAKRLYLMENGMGEIHPIVAMYEKTDLPEWKKRMKKRAIQQQEFKDKQLKFGEWGDFAYLPATQDFKKRIFHYLSIEEINEITEGNYLGVLSGKQVDNNIDKIRNALENRSENLNSKGVPTFTLLFQYEDLCPMDNMDKILTKELVNKMLGASVEPNVFDEKTKTYSSKLVMKNLRYVYAINNTSIYDIYLRSEKILEMAKTVLKEKESLNSVDDDFLLCSMLYIMEAVAGEKSQNYIKNNGKEEFSIRMGALKSFLQDNTNLLNLNRFLNENTYINLSGVINDILTPNYRVITDEEEKFKKSLIKDFCQDLLDSGGLNVAYLVNEISSSEDKFSYLTSLECHTLRELIDYEVPFKDCVNSHSFEDKKYNFIIDDEVTETEFVKTKKIRTKIYQDYVLKNNIELSDNVLSELCFHLGECAYAFSENEDYISEDKKNITNERLIFYKNQIVSSLNFVMDYLKNEPEKLANFAIMVNAKTYEIFPQFQEFLNNILKPEDYIPSVLKVPKSNVKTVISQMNKIDRDKIFEPLLKSSKDSNVIDLAISVGYKGSELMKFKDNLGLNNLCKSFMSSYDIDSLAGWEECLPELSQVFSNKIKSLKNYSLNCDFAFTELKKIITFIKEDTVEENNFIRKDIKNIIPLFLINPLIQNALYGEKVITATDLLSFNSAWLNENNGKIVNFNLLQNKKWVMNSNSQLEIRDDWMMVKNDFKDEDSILKSLNVQNKVMLYLFADMFEEKASAQEVLASTLLSNASKEIYRKNPENYEITKMRLKIHESFDPHFIEVYKNHLFDFMHDFEINLEKMFGTIASINGLDVPLVLSTKEILNQEIGKIWNNRFKNVDLMTLDSWMTNNEIKDIIFESFEMKDKKSINRFFQLFGESSRPVISNTEKKRNEFAEKMVFDLFSRDSEPLVKEFIGIFKALESSSKISGRGISLGMTSLIENVKIKEMCYAVSLKYKLDASINYSIDVHNSDFDDGFSMKL